MQRGLIGPATVIVFLLSLSPGNSMAQSALALEAGTRVRVETKAAPSEWKVGYLTSIDSLNIALEDDPKRAMRSTHIALTPPYTAPLAALRGLEVSGGTYRTARRGVVGALVGAVLGTVAIGAIGVAMTQCDCDESGIGVLAGPILGPPVGGLFGALVGIVTAPERWKAVAIPGRIVTSSNSQRRMMIVPQSCEGFQIPGLQAIGNVELASLCFSEVMR